jgi:hypothetical protein
MLPCGVPQWRDVHTIIRENHSNGSEVEKGKTNTL